VRAHQAARAARAVMVGGVRVRQASRDAAAAAAAAAVADAAAAAAAAAGGGGNGGSACVDV